MANKYASCFSMTTIAEKMWPFDQYYFGQRDEEERREGRGENHWTGAESIEWYNGDFVRDAMHGLGDYQWRHQGFDGAFTTYEGHFFTNNMHGYGTMSYPDGRVFTGIYNNNIRWGPGVESYAEVREDVGLWRGTQLIRLAWRPATPSIAPDLATGTTGRATVEPHRIILTTTRKTIGETNSAIDLLKQNGCDPRLASERWMKLYPKCCTDQDSQLCQVELFDKKIYKETLQALEVLGELSEKKDTDQGNTDGRVDTGGYFAWNNHWMTVDMMKHCFKHETQRPTSDMSRYELSCILTGPRSHFKPAGQHEIDCRTLLMSSYLGRVGNVAYLVNESDVYPDVADNKGNTALMYATCGDESDVIHFLVEAGADINNYNDSCCTSLGMALMKFVCTQWDINPSGMIQAMLPPPVFPPPPVPEHKVFEWHITRDEIMASAGPLARAPSKIKAGVTKKIKSSQSLKDLPDVNVRRRTDTIQSTLTSIPEMTSEKTSSVNEKIYNDINLEYTNKVNDLCSVSTPPTSLAYVFEVNDMVKDIDAPEPERKAVEKSPKGNFSKVLKETMKTSKEVMWKISDKDFQSLGSVERQKNDLLTQIMATILQLLADGADPSLVKCPQPGLFMAVIAGCPDLVRHLVTHGANVNEIYSNLMGYTPLDIAISLPLTKNNLELIRTLLECGSNTNYRLSYADQGEPIPGPTLLHAVLAKKAESDMEEEIRCQILELLLEYKCDPTRQFKGHSAVDIAMTKNIEMLNVFINSPTTNLNASINNTNQTILVKMFSLPFFKNVMQADRLQILTNLLLFGADPLLKCQNGEEIYENIFTFAKNTFSDMASSQIKTNPTGSSAKSDPRKQAEKPKKDEKLPNKSVAHVDDAGDFKQAQELMTELTRLLYIRWLQAKLVEDLIAIIDRFRHRQWNMILTEHKKKKSSGLWLTVQRGLEIWDILKTTKKKVYSDQRVLKHLLSIILYYHKKYKIRCITSNSPAAQEKNTIDSDVTTILREYKAVTMPTTEFMSLKRPYVKPELIVKTVNKFNICFECILPLKAQNIKCKLCNLVSFCTFECMRSNIDRSNCHPCSEYLKNIYFPSPISSGSIQDPNSN